MTRERVRENQSPPKTNGDSTQAGVYERRAVAGDHFEWANLHGHDGLREFLEVHLRVPREGDSKKE